MLHLCYLVHDRSSGSPYVQYHYLTFLPWCRYQPSLASSPQFGDLQAVKTKNSKEMGKEHLGKEHLGKETTGNVSDLWQAADPAVQVDCLSAGWPALEDLLRA